MFGVPSPVAPTAYFGFAPRPVYWAADEVRRKLMLTWNKVAADIGCISANRLESLGTGRGLLGFPKVLHTARWLDVPMAPLTLEREW